MSEGERVIYIFARTFMKDCVYVAAGSVLCYSSRTHTHIEVHIRPEYGTSVPQDVFAAHWWSMLSACVSE